MHGVHVPLGYHGVDRRVRGAVHRACCSRLRCSCSRGGTSSRRSASSHSAVRRDASSWLPCCWRAAVQVAGRCASARIRCRRGDRGHRSTSRSGVALAPARRPATPRWPRICTGSARFSTTAAPSSGSTRWRVGAGRRPPPSLAADDYPLLYPLLDITTTLDPRFNIAYRFGAIFLAEPYPARRRPARSRDRAAREGSARAAR